MNPVLTKKDFVRRYMANEFGNRAPTWDSLVEFRESGYTGLVHLRNRVAGGPTWYDVPAKEVEWKWMEVTCKVNGRVLCKESNLYLSGMAPTSETLIQGEVRRSEKGLELMYSKVPKPMREALALQCITVYGLTAKGTLQHYLDASSYDWLMELLERYVDHVVEFSCYAVCWGTIPHRNTIIWEVRNY